MKKKIIMFLGMIALLIVFAACSNNEAVITPDPTPEATPEPTPEPVAEQEEPEYEPEELTAFVEIIDREGYTVSVPAEINTIISIGPANTEIIAALGFAGQIISTDMFSGNVPGLAAGINVLDMMALDMEYIIDLGPDIVFVTGMTRVGGVDPMGPVVDMGISVIHIPMSDTIANVMDDIRFIAYVLGAEGTGANIVEGMEEAIAEIQSIAATISEEKTVYFEVSPAPWMFSFGSGTFLNEMIELIGGINVFADQEGWLGVSDEQILELNPDVILTSTDFLDDPVAEIMERDGWDTITAVQEGAVFQIDADSSSRPSHNIIAALREMAQAIYPDYFG
ncbi:MAG: ABC transporter substrate-binding protein [Defluviitaleaceae bacterium]|nr:ABC transporter substrate-binding protein [Defluviitaleaceae bacterium]